MSYCTKCGKPTDNGMICEDCIVNDSPWLSAMKRKEKDLEEEVAKLKAKNVALQARLEKAVELPKIGDEIYIIEDGYCDCAEVCEIHIQEKDTIVEWVQWDRSNYETPEFYDEGEVLMSEYNKTWFTDRAKAEARLAELKGEKQ